MSEVSIDMKGSSRGGRVATVCHDDADKLNVIDREGAEGELDDALACTVDMICAAGPAAIRLQKELLRD